jgi:hypothetical protein
MLWFPCWSILGSEAAVVRRVRSLVHRPMCGIASFLGGTASLWSANQGSQFELGEQ